MTALGKTSPSEQRQVSWTRIRYMDGRSLASTHSVSLLGRWSWIARMVAEQAECSVDDVDYNETENGDIITVHGEAFAFVDGEYVPPVAMLEAAE